MKPVLKIEKKLNFEHLSERNLRHFVMEIPRNLYPKLTKFWKAKNNGKPVILLVRPNQLDPGIRDSPGLLSVPGRSASLFLHKKNLS